MTEENLETERSRRTFMKTTAAVGVTTTGLAAFGGAASAQGQGIGIGDVNLQEGLINVNVQNVLNNLDVDVTITNVNVEVTDVVDITDNVIQINVAILGEVEPGDLLQVVLEGVNEAGQQVTLRDTQRL